MNDTGPNATTSNRSTTSYGVSSDDRDRLLLDDLRVEIARLADAVERQNELLAEERGEVDYE